MNRIAAALAGVALLAGTTGLGTAKGADMNQDLPYGEPEANGVSSPGLLEFVKAVDGEIDSLHGFVLVRHGHVVAQGWWKPYDAETPHQLWSLTKSFTSMAVGLAISEGRFGLDDEILRYFSADAPADHSDNLKTMKVRHLLTMNTGHETEPLNDGWGTNWKQEFLAHPVPNKPGSRFLYNTPASGMLAALVEKTTGMPLADYLKPRLFEPLGIHEPSWGKAGDGTTFGGFGLHLRTGEIARFGQMLLQKGKWNGKQLIPKAWISAATSLQTKNGNDPNNDWAQGYGYQFWMSRNRAYRGDGAFGQFCIVIPEKDAVLAITSGTGNMGKVMELAWNKLLPALENSVLPSNDKGFKTLAITLAALSMNPFKSEAKPTTKLPTRTYRFAENIRKIEKLGLVSGKIGSVTMVVLRDGKEWRIECGEGTWIKGLAPWGTDWEQPIAASGGWIAADTFTARICHLNSTFVHTVKLVFKGDELLIENEVNVAFGPTKLPDLHGEAE